MGKRRCRTTATFKLHDEVECQLADEDGNLTGTEWYPARVLQTRRAHDEYVVEFHSILTNEGRPKPDFVKVERIRPVPPSAGGAVKVDQRVEVFLDRAWRSGVILKTADGGKRYIVWFFDGREKVVAEKEMRKALEWKNGVWVSPDSLPSLEDNVPIKHCFKIPTRFSRRLKGFQLKAYLLEMFPDEFSGGNEIRREAPATEDQVQGKIPDDSDAGRVVEGKRRRKTTPLNLKIIKIKAKEAASPVLFPRPIPEYRMQEPFWTTGEPSNRGGELMAEVHVAPSVPAPTELITEVQVPPNHKCIQGTLVPHKPYTLVESAKTVDGLPPGWKGIDKKRTQDKLEGKMSNDSGKRKFIAGYKRRKRTPSKLAVDTAVSEGNEVDQLDGDNHAEIEREHMVDLSTIADHFIISHEGRNEEGTPRILQYEDLQGVPVNKPSTGDQTTSQAEAQSQRGTGVKSFTSTPLMTPLQIPTLVYEAEGRAQKEPSLLSSTYTLAASAVTSRVPDKMPCWPFQKTSGLWEAIYSMEEISAMPQQPHFHPLDQCSEMYREGLAISLMVTYSNLLRSIVDLNINDPAQKFDEYESTLKHLDEHGFDVQHVQAHLEKMLKLQNDHEQLLDKRSELGVLVLEKGKEKDDLLENIDKIDNVLQGFEDRLEELHEIETSRLEQWKENYSKIVNLQKQAKLIEEQLLASEGNFRNISGSS